MSGERMERIRQFRLRQSWAELDRKAHKARERANLWTQEEIDVADKDAEALMTFFNSVIAK